LTLFSPPVILRAGSLAMANEESPVTSTFFMAAGLLLLAAGGLFFHNLGIEDVSTEAEARVLLTAAEMNRTGSWLVPTVGGEGRWEKPPLYVWSVKLTSFFFDGEVTPLVGRIPGAACMLLVVMLGAWWALARRFGIKTLLKEGGGRGVAVIEVPYIRDMIDQLEFDTIYHEHLCYFSLTALDDLFSRHGLSIDDAQRVDIHGGSLRLIVHHAVSAEGERSERVDELLQEEVDCGIGSCGYYRDFAGRAQDLRDRLRGMLAEIKNEGKRIAVYGASAKGSTLLNYCGLGGETLDFVVDRSPRKQGRFTPGSHLPILDPEHLMTRCPDYVLLLTWNFKEEILAQQSAYRDRGGRFIIPIPQPEVV